ncbi:MAG: hypothetical protein ACR2MS_02590 [Weeksellaceae bacterium]
MNTITDTDGMSIFASKEKVLGMIVNERSALHLMAAHLENEGRTEEAEVLLQYLKRLEEAFLVIGGK